MGINIKINRKDYLLYINIKMSLSKFYCFLNWLYYMDCELNHCPRFQGLKKIQEKFKELYFHE